MRFREWRANRSLRFQYPSRRMKRGAELAPVRFGWKYPMLFSTRVFLFFMGIAAIAVAVPLLIVFVCILFWLVKSIM